MAGGASALVLVTTWFVLSWTLVTEVDACSPVTERQISHWGDSNGHLMLVALGLSGEIFELFYSLRDQ